MFFTISFLQAAVEEGSHSKQGAIQTVRTHLYGEKLHSYKSTVKLGGFSPIAPLSANVDKMYVSTNHY